MPYYGTDFLDSVALRTWRYIKISRSVFWTDAILYTSYSQESKKKEMRLITISLGNFHSVWIIKQKIELEREVVLLAEQSY